MKKVKYTDALAEKVVQNFGLTEGTQKRWKRQGVIPSHFFRKKTDFLILGKTLLQNRQELGLTQNEFMEAFNKKFSLNVMQPVVSGWETGLRKPSPIYARLLHRYFVSLKKNKSVL